MFKKMKTRKRLAALITLITLFAFSSVMTVMTAAQEASLISATLTTDKESYEEGENVNIALTVKNGNIYGIDKVKSEIGLPDGLTLKKGELTDGEYALAAGQSRSNEITAYIEKASKPGDTTDPVNPGNPETDGSLCPLWLTLSILSGGTLAVLGIKKKCGKRIFSLFLCAVISLTALPTDVFADEVIMPSASGSVTASKDITVNGAKKTITADITYNENKPSEEDEVTVTFDAGDGTPVAPITVKKGETISRLPESFGAGKAFMGWFTDTALTNELFTNTPINEDMTVYASFVESADDFQSGVRTTYYVEDCAEYQPITLICDEEITADNVWEYITLFAYTGDTPENFVVTSNEKDEYTLVPETAYTAGCMYRMIAGEGVTFKGLDDTVNEYTFKIYKEQTNIIEVRDNIKYLDKAKLFATDKTDEYMVQADYFEENSLAVGDVLCIDNGTKNFTENCLFVKITDTIKDRNIYYIQTADCEAEDVYDNVDVYFVEPAKNKFLEEQIDTEAIAEEVKNSEGVQQLNLVLAALLAEDETVNEIMEGEPLVTDTVTATAYAASDDDRLKDFSDYSRPKEDTLKSIAASLAIGLSVSVKVGEAENDNFTTINPDYWSVITFELNYKTTIKKKLKVDATFTVSEYLNVSFQGYNSFEFKWFELPELEFNYAANIYTQTDIELKVLVCSVGANSYRNITSEVAKMLGSDEKNDTAGLVKDVKDMLNKKGGEIEICRIPFFTAFKPLSLFQLNFELSLVVKMSFAGGIGSKFSILDATQVGTHGNSKDKEFSMYKNKLVEGDRYSFDLTVFGYVGVKMGVSGQLTVSFTGLRRLGEVGVEVQVGAYLDIYGLAKYHVVKPDHRYSTVYRTLTGGFYLEAGIYLEVNLVAESKVFKLRLEAPLIPEIKWPLFSMGDKNLVICLNDVTTPILFSSNGTYWGEVNIDNLPAVSAQTLDITTGVINYNASVPWSKLSMNVSGEGFRMLYDRRGKFIRYEQPYSMSGFYKNSTAEGVGQIHYKGTSLQFTKTADPEMSLTKSVKVIWYDESRVKEEDVGKIFTVNFYREVDGVKTLVETRKVPAGSLAGSYNTNNAPDSWKYIDCEWKDQDPYFITVDHDNYEIVIHCNKSADSYGDGIL
jgi:listeria-bacteroides repeat domain (list_Bact_rpt)